MGSTPKSRRLSRRERRELSRREQNRKLRLVKPPAAQSVRRIVRGKVKTFALAAFGTALAVQALESDAVGATRPSAYAREVARTPVDDASAPSSERRLARQPAPAASLHACETADGENPGETALQGKHSRHAESAFTDEASDPSGFTLRLAQDLNQEWENEFLTALEDILADLAARERMLRERARREKSLQDDLGLLGFGYRLWMSRFNANADQVLGKFVLGKDAMRHVNDRLLRHTPSMPDAPRFRLYNTNGNPTISGIHVWREMRKRLLRGANSLARSLKLEYGY